MVPSQRIQKLLYVLARDHLPFGTIEKILKDIERAEDERVGKFLFSEKNQEEWALSVANRLLKPNPNSPVRKDR